MSNDKFLSAEFIIGIIIASLLIISILFESLFSIVPDYLIVALFILYIMLKIYHIAKERGSIFEDYASLFIIVILALLRFLTVDTKIHTAMSSVSILIILYSVRLIPSIKRISNSKTILSFLISYAIFIFAIIFLFAGAYSTNGTAFIGEGTQSEFTFKDALYFSTMTFTTVGYGDFAPTGINRLLSSIEALIGVILNIAVIGYVLASKRFRKFRK